MLILKQDDFLARFSWCRSRDPPRTPNPLADIISARPEITHGFLIEATSLKRASSSQPCLPHSPKVHHRQNQLTQTSNA
ncbi:hypothetical protein LINPERPRIM_LOCUS33770, partial [Linum perenne]